MINFNFLSYSLVNVLVAALLYFVWLVFELIDVDDLLDLSVCDLFLSLNEFWETFCCLFLILANGFELLTKSALPLRFSYKSLYNWISISLGKFSSAIELILALSLVIFSIDWLIKSVIESIKTLYFFLVSTGISWLDITLFLIDVNSI